MKLLTLVKTQSYIVVRLFKSKLELNKIYEGDSLAVLKTFEPESIDLIITSPPYYGLRDYGTEGVIWDGLDCEHDFSINHNLNKSNHNGQNTSTLTGGRKKLVEIINNDSFGQSHFCSKCNAWKGQLGQEPTPQLYISHLMAIMNECKRVLKKTGSLWVNIDDSHGGTGSKGSYKDPKYSEGRNGQVVSVSSKLSPKCLLAIPERFVIAMTDAGWIRRNTVIWYKPNGMPESAKDRFTIDFEYFYFFTKSPKYYFETQYEPYTKPMDRWGGQIMKMPKVTKTNGDEPYAVSYRERDYRPNPNGKMKRAVWSINTKPFPGAHYAVFPREIN